MIVYCILCQGIGHYASLYIGLEIMVVTFNFRYQIGFLLKALALR